MRSLVSAAGRSCLARARTPFSLAGFEVTLIGRFFWVTPEVGEERQHPEKLLVCAVSVIE
jgi:hypothetical protein